MALALRVLAVCCLVLFGTFSLALGEGSRAKEDIRTNGSNEPAPPSNSNPLVAQVHMAPAGPMASSSEQSLNQNSANVSDNTNENRKELKDSNAEGFATLQTSANSGECSCVFWGKCMDKGACLWTAASLVFGVIIFLCLMAWALQWVVAIPAEWILAKRRFEKSAKGTFAGSPPDSTPLLGN